MKTATVVGIILIILGIVSLTYQGITYKTEKKVVDIGPIEATKTEHKTIPLPPILGGIALVGGILLVLVGKKES
ncbi:MAG TPA: hypothetical protein VGQ11_05160 [Candidatus Acidoferrales bacterium]|nr:hypothetical protein [Candidatus Acidoferrales bacterium]